MLIKSLFSSRFIIILFSVSILAGFTGLLLWITEKRAEDFYISQQMIAQQAALNVASEIERALIQKKILIRSFMEDNRKLVDSLATNPDNEQLFSSLNNRLSRYFPDFFTTNIASEQGELLIDDFDGYIGEVCVSEMKDFINNDFHEARLHPNPRKNHYDMVEKFTVKGQNYIFFTSFNVDLLATILRLSSPLNHSVLLVQKDIDYLVDVTESGDRHHLPDRLDFRMTEDEKKRVLSEVAIPASKWHVVVLHNTGLFSEYRSSILKTANILFVIVLLLVTMFSLLLIYQSDRKKQYADSLLEKNREIESLNEILSELNQTLSCQALTDGLTGLNNRRYFDKYIADEWNKARRLGLSFHVSLVDIDYFKRYNDIYGHQAGDECIKLVAKTLCCCYKRSNEFVARYGGEEFVIVEVGNDPLSVRRQVNHFIKKIEEQQLEHRGSSIKSCLSVSIGTASNINDEVSTYKELIEMADKALYEAKAQGRDQAVYNKVA